MLRDVPGLRGTKYGCGIGSCAACTVLIDGRHTKSCQTPAERAAGTAVTTVEGASATTGPRFSMTRARTRHPGSPDSHPSGRAAAPAPLQRHGDGAAAFAPPGSWRDAGWSGAGPIRDLPGFESSLKDEVSAR